MTQRYTKTLTLLGMLGALTFAAAPAIARQGADDPAGHNAGDDNGGLVAKAASNGADDPAGHDARDDRRARQARVRHRHRHHSHLRVHSARNGGDDGPSHDAGDDHGSR